MSRPAPEGSLEELVAFEGLQGRLAGLFHAVTDDDRCPHTVIVVPSLSMHASELAKITGVHHYEERLLYNLMLLRRPRTRLIFVTSQPIADPIIDYYLHLLSGVPGSHARKRLTLLACYDASPVPLSRKILDRPRLIQRIKYAVRTGDNCHMACFNSSPLERSLAVQLGVPLYSTDPALSDLGSKSGCREIFKEAGILLADGFERLRDANDITEALVQLKRRYPEMRRAVVKLNEGFSGEGNALFWFTEAPEGQGLSRWVRDNLVNLKFEAKTETWETFEPKYEEMQGIVECFVEGKNKESPSCQARVNPIGEAQVISTHDQVLGGPSGQVFLGCTFPAIDAYRSEIQDAGMKVAKVLASRGVIGRFATDFVSVPKPDGSWDHYAIEVNLRKGGTTHPFLTLKFLTDGTYDRESGLFMTPTGQPKYYYASDTLQNDRYIGITPDDLIDIAVYHGLHFHEASQRGVVFHLMGALSEFGKLGVVCIGDNPQMGRFLYKKTVGVLDQETSRRDDRTDAISKT
jgi:hypothetical protein